MIDKIEDYGGMQITFNTTEDCNLACKYCYEINKKPKTLSFDYAKKFIDLLLTSDDFFKKIETANLNRAALDFIGGDALMNPKLVDDILSYFIFKTMSTNHRWKNKWRASISTNGTLFGNPDVRKFILKYRDNLSVGVSIDGCPEIHNKNRIFKDGSPSMPAILKDWKWYLSVFGEHGRITKSTLNKDSIPYLYDSLVFMHEELNIKNINQNFIFENMDLHDEDLVLLDEQMKKCVNYILKHKDDIYWGMIDKSMFCDTKPFEQNVHDNEYSCGSGKMPTLGIDGYIYPCFRFLPHTQENYDSAIRIGSVWDGFYEDKAFRLINATRDVVTKEQKCRKCDIESACKWCIGGCYSELNELVRQTYICEAVKIQTKWAKIYWEKYDDLKAKEEKKDKIKEFLKTPIFTFEPIDPIIYS